MSLILTIINQSKPGQEISKAFAQEGTIGRALKNNWVLIDPNRFISSQHARIHSENNHYYITDLSTNGLFINRSKQPLGKGNSAQLKQGDILTIGEYEISVSVQMDSGFSPSPDASPFGVTPPAAPSNEAIPNEFPFEAPALNNFLSPEPPPAKSVSADIDADAQVDPLAMFNKPSGGSGAPLSPPPTPSSLDDLLGAQSSNAPSPSLNAGPGSNHASPLQQSFKPPQTIPDDWDFLGGPANGSANPKDNGILPPLDFETPLAPQSSIPDAVPPSSKPSPPQAAAPIPSSAAQTSVSMDMNESGILKAILDGLRMESMQLSPAEIKNFAFTMGEVVRIATEGMLTALRARSHIKNEFRMSMTTIKAKENNPLKFSATINDAMTNMFHSSSASYLPPAQAMAEGFNDLEAHMIAVMAGMQVALHAVLKRFDPENLERDFEQRQSGFSMLPGGKKAKHWDAYLQHYKDIIASAEDDFQTFFGDEFTRAYEEQVRKLKQARSK